MHAQRLLVERGETDVVPGLIALVQDQAVDAIGLNVGAIHALWTLHGLGLLDGTGTTHRGRHRRTAAIRRRAFGGTPAGAPANAGSPAHAGCRLLADPDAQVRLAACSLWPMRRPREQPPMPLASALTRGRYTHDRRHRWLPERYQRAAQ